jgi:hypothetical protein
VDRPFFLDSRYWAWNGAASFQQTHYNETLDVTTRIDEVKEIELMDCHSNYEKKIVLSLSTRQGMRY